MSSDEWHLTESDLAFIDAFCDENRIPKGYGFYITLLSFLNTYKKRGVT